MSFRNRRTVCVVLAILAAWPVGCSKGYEPGLGELMSLNQMRHAKLWFAGQARNWELADYELDELEEGFADVVKSPPRSRPSPRPPGRGGACKDDSAGSGRLRIQHRAQ